MIGPGLESREGEPPGRVGVREQAVVEANHDAWPSRLRIVGGPIDVAINEDSAVNFVVPCVRGQPGRCTAERLAGADQEDGCAGEIPSSRVEKQGVGYGGMDAPRRR